jgi:hypothetical protein
MSDAKWHYRSGNRHDEAGNILTMEACIETLHRDTLSSIKEKEAM